MKNYITGSLIKSLRENKKMTQAELASLLIVSEKTISKWETGRGLPDISLIEPLAKALNVSILELFNGEQIINSNKSANMLKTKFYVCPICGNVISSIGNCAITCCGIELQPEEAENGNCEYIEALADEYYINIPSIMSKDDYISFVSYVTSDGVNFKKIYPEQSAEVSFSKRGHGFIYYYSNRNGLFKVKI